MPKKDFTDKRAAKKEKKQQEKLLTESKRETAKALKKHKLGWQTQDGKRF